ncbi:hypothetical protein DZ11F44_45260 [Escherichia coli]
MRVVQLLIYKFGGDSFLRDLPKGKRIIVDNTNRTNHRFETLLKDNCGE